MLNLENAYPILIKKPFIQLIAKTKQIKSKEKLYFDSKKRNFYWKTYKQITKQWKNNY